MRFLQRQPLKYYSKKLNDNKHDIKKTWITLREIISKTSIRNTAPTKLKLCQEEQFYLELDQQDLIAEFLNNLFSSTGERTLTLNIDPLIFVVTAAQRKASISCRRIKKK